MFYDILKERALGYGGGAMYPSLLAISGAVGKANGSVVTISDGANGKALKSLVVGIDAVQSGSGDPSPDNVRPITGWTGATIYRTKSNILPKMVAGTYEGNSVKFVVDENGVCTMSGTTSASGNAVTIPLEHPFTYTQEMYDAGFYLHLNNSAVNGSAAPALEYSAGVQTASYSFATVNRVISLSSNIGYTFKQVRFWLSSGLTISGTFAPAIVKSATATAYEPYGSKNLVNESLCGYTAANIYYGCTSSNTDADGSFVLPAGTYTMSVSEKATGLYVKDDEGTNIKTVYNNTSLTFTISESTSIKLLVYINGKNTALMQQVKLQLEVGSTATDYEPYVGKNLMRQDYYETRTSASDVSWTVNPNKSITFSGTASGTIYFNCGNASNNTFTLSAGTYTLKGTGNANVRVTLVKDGSYFTNANSSDVTFTLTETAVFYVYIYVASGAATNLTVYPQIEVGSVSTAYQPYGDTMYYVGWESEAGTVYGGTLNVTTGLLTVTHGSFNASSITWTGFNALDDSTGNYVYKVNVFSPANTNVISDKYKWKQANKWESLTYGEFMTSTTLIVTVPTSVTTTAEAKTHFTNNDATFVYELATPVTYQLTPTEITTFLGTNNIWADCGDIESVVYRRS